MSKTITLENYPLWIVFITNLGSILIYALGFFIIFQTGWYVAGVYLLYILFLEIRLIKSHCVDCYYYGKTCGFGKGRISALFFKKGKTVQFCNDEMTWTEMIPDMLVSFVPLIAGIILLIFGFDVRILTALILLVLLVTIGNSFIRGSLACKYCKQKELGCPAEKLFNKEK